MPAKSKQQFKKIAVLYKQGKISKQTFNDFDKGVNYKSLPKRAKKSR